MLTLDNQQQDLSGLNTDLGKANTTVTPYDIDRLKARQESAAALSELLNGLAGDLSNQLHFAEGGPEKAALHAAVGAIVAKMAGGDIAAGAVAGAASEIANGVLQEVLKANPNLSDPDRKAITQWVAVVVGAVAGGEAGAATAIDNVNFNYLTHEQAEKYRQDRAALDSAYAACKARLGNGCSVEDLAYIDQQKAVLNAEVQAQNTQNNVDLVKACSQAMASLACVNGREELQKALDQDAGLQQSLLGGGHTNPQDAILNAVLARVDQGEVTADKLGSAYQQALVKDQKITAGVALTALAVAGATIAPEVYSYCMFGNPNACVAVVEAAGCVASGACDNLAGAVGSMGEATAAKATGQLEKLAGSLAPGKVIIVDGSGNALIGGWSFTKKLTAPENALAHWTKHGTEFPEYSNASQYVEAAQHFVSSPPSSVLTKVRNGDTILYDPVSNTFAVRAVDGVPRTMFRPDPSKHGYPTNMDYFNAQ